MKESLKARH